MIGEKAGGAKGGEGRQGAQVEEEIVRGGSRPLVSPEQGTTRRKMGSMKEAQARQEKWGLAFRHKRRRKPRKRGSGKGEARPIRKNECKRSVL